MDRYLFLDDVHIAKMDGLTRRAHKAEKHPDNPVMRRDHPWEATRVQIYGRDVIYDPRLQKFRMYYIAQPNGQRYEHVQVNGRTMSGITTLPAYAESRDGIHWTKPMLGQCSFNDSPQTNIMDFCRGHSFQGGVLYDPVDPNDARRYKMFYWDQRIMVLPKGRDEYLGDHPDRVAGDFLGRMVRTYDEQDNLIDEQPYIDFGMDVAFSSDGLHWYRHPEGPVLRCYSDTGHSVVYDPKLRRYVGFGRFNNLRLADGRSFGVGRGLARVESDDFIHWTDPEMVLRADAGDVAELQIDAVPVDLYGGLYIGRLQCDVRMHGDQQLPMQMAVSRDGRHWTRVADRFDFLDVGADGEWDSKCIRPGSALIPFGDKVMSYYCSGVESFEGIGLATWRRDGFVSLHAGADGGELITAPLMTDPRWQLHVNCAAADGEVVVALCDHQGAPLDEDQQIISGSPYEPPSQVSQPIRTDGTDIAVQWRQPRPFPQRPMALRFRMRNADLFSFWFSDINTKQPQR
jgi:hypothetical protein